ncbi:MAG: Uncharacterised protein [Hyphomonas sp. TMED17]|nr:MAG: Uncharacterised protein [Hyphomonas sp. TMED17]
MNGFTRIGADFDKLFFAFAAPFFRIVIIDNFTVGIQQITISIALEDRSEIPAMAMIIGELGVVEVFIQVVNITQEVEITPKPANRRTFRISLQDFPGLFDGRISLLFRPH